MWTLDYPPAFAFFEWWLSRFAVAAVGDEALQLTAEAIRSWPVVLFQRASVIASELPLYVALCALVAARLQPPVSVRVQLTRLGGLRGGQDPGRASADSWLSAATRSCATTCTLVLLHSGLVLVDNIHFQYNGYLLSMLVGGLAAAYAGQPVLAVLLLALLALHKHLFAVLAPAAVVYLAATAIPHARGTNCSSAAIAVVCRLVTAVVLVAVLSLAVIAPVLVEDWSGAAAAVVSPRVWVTAFANVRAGDAAALLPSGGEGGGRSSSGSTHALIAAEAILRNGLQLLARLFPFSRGLVHAYWAPNAWALYMACDKVAAAVAKRLGLPLPLLGPRATSLAVSNTAGESTVPVPGHAHLPHAVNSSSFLAALPSPTPLVCGFITLLLLLPALWRLWRGCLPVVSGSSAPALQSPADRHRNAARHLHTAVVVSYGVAFAFGWHAHEKAALYVALPLLLLAVDPSTTTTGAWTGVEAAGEAAGDVVLDAQAQAKAAAKDSDAAAAAAKPSSALRRRPQAAARGEAFAEASSAHERAPEPSHAASTLASRSVAAASDLESDSDTLSQAQPSYNVTAAAWAIHLSASVAVLPLIFTSLEVPFVLLHALAYSRWLREQLPGVSKANVFWRVLLPAALCFAALLHTFCLPGKAAVCVRFPFLPLAAVSLACAAGMLAATAALYISWLRSSD